MAEGQVFLRNCQNWGLNILNIFFIFRRDLYTNVKNDLFENLRLFSAHLGAKVLFRRLSFNFKSNKSWGYFNVRNFRVQKISRISRMTPQFAKLNGREKNILADSRKFIPTRHSFQVFLINLCLLEHKSRFLSLFYSCFCLGKSNFAKINSNKMNLREGYLFQTGYLSRHPLLK